MSGNGSEHSSGPTERKGNEKLAKETLRASLSIGGSSLKGLTVCRMT